MLLLVSSALAAPSVTCDAASIDVPETCTSGESVEVRVLTEGGAPLPEACDVAWSADAGDFAEESGAVVSWTCPACDDATVYVIVTDEAGAQDWGFAEVEVTCAEASASGCASGGAGGSGGAWWAWGLAALGLARRGVSRNRGT